MKASKHLQLTQKRRPSAVLTSRFPSLTALFNAMPATAGMTHFIATGIKARRVVVGFNATAAAICAAIGTKTKRHETRSISSNFYGSNWSNRNNIRGSRPQVA